VKTTTELCDIIAMIYKVVPGNPSSLSQTGEPYVEIGLGGILPAGYRHDFVSKFETAIALLHGEIMNYIWSVRWEAGAPPDNPTIYWRTMPEIGEADFYCEDVYRVRNRIRKDGQVPLQAVKMYKGYARLLATYKPPLQDVKLCTETSRVDISGTALAEKLKPNRQERLAIAKAAGIEICPSCAMVHSHVDACYINPDIWQAVVDIARG
jgi:hypothetical protein